MKKNLSLLKLISMVLIIFFVNPNLFSQEEEPSKEPDVEELLDFNLESIMEMTVVSASRHEQKVIESPRSISVITAKEIREKNYRTTPEALNELLGVHVQETNYGGGSPILRGLVGNQILIMVDGVRMNNGIYRLGPNQYLNTIDINEVEQIEVVRGAGSVLYGSDALGGLINIITKSKVKKSDGTDGLVSVFGRYASADKSGIGRVEMGTQLGKLSFFGGLSYKNFNDLKAGKNTGLQKYTGYSQWDGDMKLNYQPGEKHNLVLGYQHVKQSDVPRSDVLLQGADLERHWRPELRDLIYLDYNFANVTSFIDNLTAKASYHIQSEDVYRIAASKPNLRNHYSDKVNTIEGSLQFSSSINDNHMLIYGADFSSDIIKSQRTDTDLKTGKVTQAAGNYANDSKNSTLAAFVQDEIKLSDAWAANLGIRYTKVNVKATLQDKNIGNVNVDINPGAFVGSGYIMYKFSENFNVSAGISQGFRAPNIDDATVLGITSNKFQYPNPELKPERSLNYELGFKISSEIFSGSLFGFYSNIKDLILNVPGTYNGLTYLDINNNGIKDATEPDVYTRENLGEGQIFGFETEGKYKLTNNLELNGNLSWTLGEDKITNEPLTRIPPLRGKLAAIWRINNALWLEYYSLFASKQDRLSPSDKADKRIPTGGTPGWITFNIRGGYDFSNYGRVTLGIENISNASYRLHASGIDAPGLNFIMGYDISL